MSREVADRLDALEAGASQEDAEQVRQAAQRLRQHLEAELGRKAVEVEDALLAKRRRIHQRLEVVEAKAQAGRFADAEEDLAFVREASQELVARLASRQPSDEAQPPSRRAAWLAAFGTLARREARELVWCTSGGVLAGLVLVVAAWALTSAPGPDLAAVWQAGLEPVLVLAPLVGLLVGVESLDRDVRANRVHLLANAPLSRAGTVAAKATGVLAALGGLLLAPLLLVGLVGLGLGMGPSLAASARFLVGTLLLATSFAALGLLVALSARRRGTALGLGVAAYVLLGPVWQAAFQATTGPTSDVGAVLVYHASPIAAARWTIEAGLDPAAGPVGVGLLALIAWSLAGVGIAAALVQREGLPRN